MKVEIPNHLLVKVSGMVSRGIKEAEINEEGILVFTLTDGTKLELGSVKGDQGPRGESGVYVGTGEMPEDCNVQIDPSGEAFEFIQPPKTASIGQALLVKSVDENGKPTEWETGEVKGGSGGTNDHSKLSNRNAADQHPIGAITGLEAALGDIPEVDNTLTKSGQAADAAKVGEELRSLSEEIAGIPTGKDGADGKDGITPTIGDNGNWYLGDTDTGKPSRGEPGRPGADGKDGAPGAAGSDGYTPVKGTDYFTDADKQEIAEAAAGMVSIPDKLPNPNALTFTGAVTGSYDGSAPLSVEIPSGGGGSSGGSGKAKSQILIDQEITELTASLSVTLEHDFHNLTAIINCGSAGAALTAGSDGTAVASKIGLLIDTTSFGNNPRKVAQINTSTGMWKTMMCGAEWADDLSVFKRGFTVEIATGTNSQYNFLCGGPTAMYGTVETVDNVPRTGKTANIVVNGAYLNVGTRVVLWGEYYE